MLSGAQVFEGFDDAQRRAAAETDAADRELAALTARRDALHGDEAAALRDLARLHLSALQGGAAPIAALDAASSRIRAALAERAAAVARADRVVAERNAALEAARADAQRAGAAVATAERETAAALEAARDALRSDAAWQKVRTAADEAQRTAVLARQKANLANEEQAVKGQPYRDDQLFRYLWDRGFGTANYRAGPITRMLDRWVARVAGFEAARRSYALLTALPAGLAAHAQRMADMATAALDQLAAREREAAGVPPSAELDRLHARQDALEAALEAAQHAATAAARERATLAAGDDPAGREAVAALEEALGDASLRELRAAAARTPTRDDDALVTRLEQAAVERERLDWRIGEQRRLAAEARERLDRLAETRAAARQQGYGSGGFDIGTGAVLGGILGEVLRGSLDRGGFLDRMGRHRAPGPWGAPSGGPWGGGSSGGFGGGGFRTGGSMGGGGGGGFKTGGSF